MSSESFNRSPETINDVEKRIKEANNFEELLDVLGSIEGLQGSSRWYGQEELVSNIELARSFIQNIPLQKRLEWGEGAKDILFTKITRTAGLRDKVWEFARKV